MDYQPLGRTGMRVSRLCLGTANFGAWGRTDAAACRLLVDLALDAGVNFVDTADAYVGGEAEEMLGRALAGRRDDVVLASKFRYPAGPDELRRGGSRRWIMQAVEHSLERLGTDWIDLYQMHAPDPDTPIEETIGALDDLVRAGKIRAFGTSSFHAEQLSAAHWTGLQNRTNRFATEQPPYSLFVRDVENHVLPTCQELSLGVLVFGVVNSGWLSGRYRRGHDTAEDSRAKNWPVSRERFDLNRPAAQRKLDLIDALEQLGAEADLTLTEIAIGFALEHPAVTSAIIGPRTADQLTDLLGAADTRLPVDVLDALDALAPPGTSVDPADLGHAYALPGLDPAHRRRATAAPAADIRDRHFQTSTSAER
jgi:aryl-alcohol dehydrogenase-like predicted oxidoreductase